MWYKWVELYIIVLFVIRCVNHQKGGGGGEGGRGLWLSTLLDDGLTPTALERRSDERVSIM